MKSFLFVLSSAAYSGNSSQESLDVILITAAFEQEVSLLLLGEAIFHLKKSQNKQGQSGKNIGSIYRSLALYDVENIYVEQDALIQQGLTQDDLLLSVKILNKLEISVLIQKFDFVLSA